MTRIADVEADVKLIRKTLDRLSPKTLAELQRHARYITQADGYATSVRKQPGGGTNPLTSTESGALRRIGWDEDKDGNPVEITDPFDPKADEIIKILTWIAIMAKTAGPLQSKIDYVLTGHIIEDRSGYCQACNRFVTGIGADPVEGRTADLIQSGYCHTCYVAWWREGKPDRMAFNQRRAAVHNESPAQR